jgi:hypothetical protein
VRVFRSVLFAVTAAAVMVAGVSVPASASTPGTGPEGVGVTSSPVPVVGGELPAAMVGTVYSADLPIEYTSGRVVSLIPDAATLPAGLSVSSAGQGTLVRVAGVPAQGGDYQVGIELVGLPDGGTSVVRHTTLLTLHVEGELPGIGGPTPGSATRGQAYTHQFTLTGPGTYIESAHTPSWMSLDKTTGMLTGTVPTHPEHGETVTVSLVLRNLYGATTHTVPITLVGNVHLVTRHVSLPNMARDVITLTCPTWTHPWVRNTPGNVMTGLNAVYEDTESTAFLRKRHLVNHQGHAYGIEVTIKNADGLGRHLWTDLTLHCTNNPNDTITP